MANLSQVLTTELASQLFDQLTTGNEIRGQWIVEAWAPDGERYAPQFFATSLEAELGKLLMEYLSIHQKGWDPVSRLEVRPAPQGTRVILSIK